MVLSPDIKLNSTLDLADPEGHLMMKDDVAKGEWDYITSTPVFLAEAFPWPGITTFRGNQVR